jgi:hypothetical protein
MKNFLLIISLAATATSCSWITNKSNEWGSHLPVANEEKRCANSYFCGSEARSATPSQHQYQPPSPNVQPMPAQPQPQSFQQFEQNMGGAYQPAGYNAGVAPYAPQAAAMPPQQMNYANDPATAMYNQSPEAFQAQQLQQMQAATQAQQYGMPQPANYGGMQPGMMPAAAPMQMPAAMPQAGQIPPAFYGQPMPQMPADMPMIPTNPYTEAANDPRLNSFEANPEWKDKLPPERSQAAIQHEMSQQQSPF